MEIKVSNDNRTKKSENDSGGSLSEGLSSQGPIDRSYEPRGCGQGQRPSSPKAEKAGKFIIR